MYTYLGAWTSVGDARRGGSREAYGDASAAPYAPWHFLNFLPEPHQHGSLRPIVRVLVDAALLRRPGMLLAAGGSPGSP